MRRSEVGKRRLVDLELISMAELASRWKLSRSTVRRCLNAAGVRPFYFGGGRNSSVRYSVVDIEEFLRKSQPQKGGLETPNAAPGESSPLD